jgi:hypothetical protein
VVTGARAGSREAPESSALATATGAQPRDTPGPPARGARARGCNVKYRPCLAPGTSGPPVRSRRLSPAQR